MNEPSNELVNAITAIVREADQTFQRVGGSSRHWVRDCFLPELERQGWQVVPASPAWVRALPSVAEAEAAMKIKRANARKKAWQTRRAGQPRSKRRVKEIRAGGIDALISRC